MGLPPDQRSGQAANKNNRPVSTTRTKNKARTTQRGSQWLPLVLLPLPASGSLRVAEASDSASFCTHPKPLPARPAQGMAIHRPVQPLLLAPERRRHAQAIPQHPFPCQPDKTVISVTVSRQLVGSMVITGPKGLQVQGWSARSMRSHVLPAHGLPFPALGHGRCRLLRQSRQVTGVRGAASLNF